MLSGGFVSALLANREMRQQNVKNPYTIREYEQQAKFGLEFVSLIIKRTVNFG